MGVEGAPANSSASESRLGLAIGALVVGVLAALTAFTVVLGVVLGVTALAMGGAALLGVERSPQTQAARTMAIVGVSTGVIGLVGGLVVMMFFWQFAYTVSM